MAIDDGIKLFQYLSAPYAEVILVADRSSCFRFSLRAVLIHTVLTVYFAIKLLLDCN